MLKFHQDGSNEVFYATKNSAGFDLFAQHELVIEPGCWALVNTGLKIVESSKGESLKLGQFEITVIPELQIRPRSGLAAKFGITVLNSPSTIDADYRGEIKVTLMNHSQKKFVVCAGDRIAQGICSLVFHAPGVSVQDVERGTNGFGSTGGVTHSS